MGHYRPGSGARASRILAWDDPRPPAPYGSARDLPSYRELAEQLRGAKLLTRFIARDQRANVLMVEEQLNHLTDVVDRFYERLGERHWVFHDTLSVSAVENLLDTTSTPASAEKALIELYRDPGNAAFWIQRLRAVDGLRERFHQIERAREHYDAEQYDSAVLQLISVMDGFVNDFEPSRRRVLASREPDEMTAWDSVVGHHMGLTNALKAFTRTLKKRATRRSSSSTVTESCTGCSLDSTTWSLQRKHGACSSP